MRKELYLFKSKSSDASSENQNLNIALKESQNKLAKCEKELLNSTVDLETCQYENKKLVSELTKQKVSALRSVLSSAALFITYPLVSN